MQEEVRRAVARVLRYEDGKKVWHTQNELRAKLKDMKRSQYDDEGVLLTMVRDVIQDGAGSNKRERFVK